MTEWFAVSVAIVSLLASTWLAVYTFRHQRRSLQSSNASRLRGEFHSDSMLAHRNRAWFGLRAASASGRFGLTPNEAIDLGPLAEAAAESYEDLPAEELQQSISVIVRFFEHVATGIENGELLPADVEAEFGQSLRAWKSALETGTWPTDAARLVSSRQRLVWLAEQLNA